MRTRNIIGLATATVVALGVLIGGPTAVIAATPPTPGSVAVVGDIACDPADPNFNGGAGTANYCHEAATANIVAGINPERVFVLGDSQYNDPAASKYAASYNPTWGVYKSRTTAVLGNHETYGGGTSGYYTYFGSAAGSTTGYWSYDITFPSGTTKYTWHVVVLNSECAYQYNNNGVGCAVGSPQYNWLKNDLSMNASKTCTLVMDHRPRWASDSWYSADIQPLVDLMGQYHVDLFLAGHAHNYERFNPQTSSGAASSTGIREMIIGTGGQDKRGFGTTAPNSAFRASAFGVLKLQLAAGSYQWKYVADPSTPVTDSGTGYCH